MTSLSQTLSDREIHEAEISRRFRHRIELVRNSSHHLTTTSTNNSSHKITYLLSAYDIWILVNGYVRQNVPRHDPYDVASIVDGYLSRGINECRICVTSNTINKDRNNDNNRNNSNQSNVIDHNARMLVFKAPFYTKIGKYSDSAVNIVFKYYSHAVENKKHEIELGVIGFKKSLKIVHINKFFRYFSKIPVGNTSRQGTSVNLQNIVENKWLERQVADIDFKNVVSICYTFEKKCGKDYSMLLSFDYETNVLNIYQVKGVSDLNVIHCIQCYNDFYYFPVFSCWCNDCEKAPAWGNFKLLSDVSNVHEFDATLL